ncbi:MAG: Flp pilus assembly protein CpaB, partial [Pseudomonadota bacterium]
KFGAPIAEDDVRVIQWPAAHAPENAFSKPEELFGEDGAKRTALRRMDPNEPVLKSKVTGFGERATVATLIEDGMRAYTLPVNAATSVGGFLMPGAEIDVFLTVQDRDRGPTTRLLIQDLEVVAVDQDTDPDRIEARVAKTVTVQGTPEQVRELTLATTLGSISIALRGYGSEQVADLGPLDRQTLLGEIEEPEPQQIVVAEPEPEPEVKVTVRRGNEVEVKTMQ